MRFAATLLLGSWFMTPPDPITREEASATAPKAIAGLRASAELVILEDKTLERDFGWVFFYTAKRYLETKDRKHLVPGNGPLVVEKDGATHFLSGSAPPQQAIEEFEKRWRARPRRPLHSR